MSKSQTLIIFALLALTSCAVDLGNVYEESRKALKFTIDNNNPYKGKFDEYAFLGTGLTDVEGCQIVPFQTKQQSYAMYNPSSSSTASSVIAVGDYIYALYNGGELSVYRITKTQSSTSKNGVQYETEHINSEPTNINNVLHSSNGQKMFYESRQNVLILASPHSVHFIDIADPTEPFETTYQELEFETEVNKVFYLNYHLYALLTDGTVNLYDTSNLDSITLRHTFDASTLATEDFTPSIVSFVVNNDYAFLLEANQQQIYILNRRTFELDEDTISIETSYAPSQIVADGDANLYVLGHKSQNSEIIEIIRVGDEYITNRKYEIKGTANRIQLMRDFILIDQPGTLLAYGRNIPNKHISQDQTSSLEVVVKSDQGIKHGDYIETGDETSSLIFVAHSSESELINFQISPAELVCDAESSREQGKKDFTFTFYTHNCPSLEIVGDKNPNSICKIIRDVQVNFTDGSQQSNKLALVIGSVITLVVIMIIIVVYLKKSGQVKSDYRELQSRMNKLPGEEMKARRDSGRVLNVNDFFSKGNQNSQGNSAERKLSMDD